MKKIKAFLLRKLITEDESYVLYWAIDFRIDDIQKRIITDHRVDRYNASLDIKTLRTFQDIFNDNNRK